MSDKISFFFIIPMLAASLLVGSAEPCSAQDERQPGEQYLLMTGTVVLENGTPAPESMRVDLICNGQIVRQAYLDVKGQFNIELGTTNPRGLGDASITTGPDVRSIARGQDELIGGGRAKGETFASPSPGRIKMAGCEIRVPPTPGFSAETISLETRSVFDDPNVGTIVLRRATKADPFVVTLTTLAAPNDARQAFDQALAELGKENVDYSKVNQNLEKAVKIYPKFALAWNQMGNARLAQDDREGARAAFEKARAADKDFLGPCLGLARLDLEAQQFDKALEYTTLMLEQNSDHPQARYYDGMVRYRKGQLDEAKKSLLVVKEAGSYPIFPMSALILGIIHQKQGDIPKAAEEFRAFLKVAPPGPASEKLKAQISSSLTAWEARGVIQQESPPTPPGSNQP